MKTLRTLTTVTLCACVAVGLAAVTDEARAGAGKRSAGAGKGRLHDTSWHVENVKLTDDIWSQFNAGSVGFSVLNPYGDLNGDLWPTVVESPVAPDRPWVVWSRFNGRDYDLAWSRWKGARWSTVRSMHQDLALGDDLDADLSFDPHGRPYAVWWRNEDGMGRIYMSVFLNSRWMAPFPVSDMAKDCRYPSIEVYGGGRIVVEYETQAGLFAQIVRFNQPVTITDDINPFGHVRLVGKAMIVRHRRF